MLRRKPHLIAASTITLILTLAGCTLNPSRADVVGNYELRGIKSGNISLSLRDDGTYNEEISWPSTRRDHLSGNWNLRDGDVQVIGLWIPKEFAPAYIIAADERSSPPMPKSTEPGNWNLSTEKRWGVAFLTVFPDDDVEFKKVSDNEYVPTR